MSGTQWEVVGKNKKANGQSNKLSKSEKKKFVENAPKAEDILPAMEVKTLYTSLSKPGSDKTKSDKPKESSKNKSAVMNNKPVSKPDNKVNIKKQPTVEKKKVPHGMEECIKALDVSELTSLVESGKAQFPQDSSVWLRSLAGTLNSKLPSNTWSDNASISRSLLAFCPNKLSKFLLGVVRDIEPSRRAFYENCLAAIANDMSKGVPVNGWMLLTEALSEVAPELAVSNLPRWTSLMKSYQNRAAIGNCLMWGLAQSGLRDLRFGLEVWQQIFVPAAELKSYTRFAVDSLMQFFTAAVKRNLNTELNLAFKFYDYEHLLTKILSFVNHGAINKEVASLFVTFQELAEQSVDKSTIFKALFGAIKKVPSSHPVYSQILASLSKLTYDDQVILTWAEAYRNNLAASALLLRYLHSHWNKNTTRSNNFKEFLMKVKDKDASKLKGVDKAGLMECQRLIEDLLKKVNNMSGGFPWKTANFLLILAISGLAAYDINIHGSFQSSSTGIFLRESGALYYGQKAYDNTQFYCQSIYKWGEKELPPIWAQYGSPTWEVVKEQSLKATTIIKAWALNVANWASETWPVVANYIEQYAPGLLGKCQELSVTAWGYTKHYGELGFGHAKNASLSAVTWVNSNVLVLSPENLSRVSLEAYNATQTFAIDTYHWISEKVLSSTTKNA